jgi:hypothetical protein
MEPTNDPVTYGGSADTGPADTAAPARCAVGTIGIAATNSSTDVAVTAQPAVRVLPGAVDQASAPAFDATIAHAVSSARNPAIVLPRAYPVIQRRPFVEGENKMVTKDKSNGGFYTQVDRKHLYNHETDWVVQLYRDIAELKLGEDPDVSMKELKDFVDDQLGRDDYAPILVGIKWKKQRRNRG